MQNLSIQADAAANLSSVYTKLSIFWLQFFCVYFIFVNVRRKSKTGSRPFEQGNFHSYENNALATFVLGRTHKALGKIKI